MPFELQIVDGTTVGRRILIGSDETTIGRTSRAMHVIASDGVMSSLHFKVWGTETDCWLQDLGSTNGTYVNGQSVKEKTLSLGDMITAGGTTFELRFNHTAPPVSKSAAPQATAPKAKPAADAGPKVVASNALLDNTPQPKEPSAIRPPTASAPAPDPKAPVPDRAVPVPPAPTPPPAPAAPAAQPAANDLRVEIHGISGLQSVQLPQQSTLTFGRTARANVVVDDELISGLHFSLERSVVGILLTDLDSRNGTFYKGRRIGQSTLEAGDKFVAGRTTFSVGTRHGHSKENDTVADASDDNIVATTNASLEPDASEPARATQAKAHVDEHTTDVISDAEESSPPSKSDVAVALESDDPAGAVASSETAPLPTIASKVPPEQPTKKPAAAKPSNEAAPVASKSPAGDKPIVTGTIQSKWPYAKGLQDQDERVRAAALVAALCSRQTWLLTHCRAAAAQLNPTQRAEIQLLALLGDEADLAHFEMLVDADALHATRLRCTGAFGHAATIPALGKLLEAGDEAEAREARRALQKITGAEVDSQSGAQDEATKLASNFPQATRFLLGHPLADNSDSIPNSLELTMEARLEYQLRSIFRGDQRPTVDVVPTAIDYLLSTD